MRFSTCWLSLLLGLVTAGCGSGSFDRGEWVRLLPVDGTEALETGYGQGVSAPFIGHLDPEQRVVVVAGGCNFPETPAAEGGAKRYYDRIYRLDTVTDRWVAAGRLPQPLAYGASISVPGGGVLCAGGTNSTGRPVSDAFRLTDKGIRHVASMPRAVDNCAGAYLDGRCYVAGDRVFLVYDLATDSWHEGPLWPGGRRRLQPTVTAQAGRIWLFGGYDPADSAGIDGEGYVYDPTTEAWAVVEGPTDGDGEPLLAAGGASVAWGSDSILCLGGVNTPIFEAALARTKALAAEPGNDSLRQAQREYMEREPAWYRFNDRVRIYNTTTGRWTCARSEAPALAGAGAVVLRRGRGSTFSRPGLLLFNGECKPGIRSPEVWWWR